MAMLGPRRVKEETHQFGIDLIVGAVFLNIGILKCSLITEKGRTTCCAEDAASSRP